MATTIDATIGGTGSNCYTTLADANAWHEDSLAGTRWAAYTTAQRTIALLQATRQIEALPLIGTPYDDDQALHFPRSTDTEDGELIIPAGIIAASCEQALYLLDQQDAPELLDRRSLQHQGVRIANLDGIYEQYQAGGAEGKFGVDAWDYLRPFRALTAAVPTRGGS